MVLLALLAGLAPGFSPLNNCGVFSFDNSPSAVPRPGSAFVDFLPGMAYRMNQDAPDAKGDGGLRGSAGAPPAVPAGCERSGDRSRRDRARAGLAPAPQPRSVGADPDAERDRQQRVSRFADDGGDAVEPQCPVQGNPHFQRLAGRVGSTAEHGAVQLAGGTEPAAGAGPVAIQRAARAGDGGSWKLDDSKRSWKPAHIGANGWSPSAISTCRAEGKNALDIVNPGNPGLSGGGSTFRLSARRAICAWCGLGWGSRSGERGAGRPARVRRPAVRLLHGRTQRTWT